MKADRRDKNEARIVNVWRGLGYTWIPMKPGQGFDGLLITPHAIHVVEVKNGKRSWTLTDCEARTKERIEALGQSYDIVESLDDALALVGAL